MPWLVNSQHDCSRNILRLWLCFGEKYPRAVSVTWYAWWRRRGGLYVLEINWRGYKQRATQSCKLHANIAQVWIEGELLTLPVMKIHTMKAEAAPQHRPLRRLCLCSRLAIGTLSVASNRTRDPLRLLHCSQLAPARKGTAEFKNRWKSWKIINNQCASQEDIYVFLVRVYKCICIIISWYPLLRIDL